MGLSRSDLLPVLTIMTGGIIGASLSFSVLARSPSGDVPAPDPVVESSAPVAAPASSAQASGFDLQQNYPNPFNSETTIPFILHDELFAEGRPALVSIRIFNVLTQPVTSPVALSHSAGEGAS